MDHSKIVNDLIKDVKTSSRRTPQGGKADGYATYAKFSSGSSTEVEVSVTLLDGVDESPDARQFREVITRLQGRISFFGPIGYGCMEENAFRVYGVVPVTL